MIKPREWNTQVDPQGNLRQHRMNPQMGWENITVREVIPAVDQIIDELIENCLASTAETNVSADRIAYRKELYQRACEWLRTPVAPVATNEVKE